MGEADPGGIPFFVRVIDPRARNRAGTCAADTRLGTACESPYRRSSHETLGNLWHRGENLVEQLVYRTHQRGLFTAQPTHEDQRCQAWLIEEPKADIAPGIRFTMAGTPRDSRIAVPGWSPSDATLDQCSNAKRVDGSSAIQTA
jgi:hypothetical protein